MIVIHKSSVLSQYLLKKAENPVKTGFVPTMGALHEGHIGLIQESLDTCEFTSCSIFVNPTQFNNITDFQKYPLRTESDIRLLEHTGAHLLFLPAVPDIYPGGTTTLPHYDLGALETILEGKYRPGHFQGVCQVMDRLLQVVQPDVLFMGQKDYQQCMVVNKLIGLRGFKTQLVPCATRRETDGLAMSSRNLRLTETDRQLAPLIFNTLSGVKKTIRTGNLRQIKEEAKNKLETNGFRVDYFEIANASTLEPLDNWNGLDPVVALTAAFLGEVRLIDNLVLSGHPFAA